MKTRLLFLILLAPLLFSMPLSNALETTFPPLIPGGSSITINDPAIDCNGDHLEKLSVSNFTGIWVYTCSPSGGSGDSLGNHTATQTLNMNNNILDNVLSIGQDGDKADSGFLQMQNSAALQWESSPTGNDISLQVDSNEDYLLDTDANNFNFNLNPLINAIFDVAGTGNRLTSTGTALGDLLKSDGTDFKRFAKGSPSQVLKVNAGGTDLEWGTDNTGGISDGDKTDITVSGSGATWTIDNDVVTYAKIQNIVNDDRFLGRISGANGDMEELTGTQATTLLDIFTTSLKGLVPSGGSSSTYLRGDVTWQSIPSPTVLSSDSTCTATATYCTIWTIPLTASSGNYLNVEMIGDSNTAGVAIQMRVQFDNAGNNGYCTYRTFTTATGEILDVLAATAATDTGETAWLAGANIPMPLDIICGFETDASPGNALIQIQMESAATGTIQKGSYYIKTP